MTESTQQEKQANVLLLGSGETGKSTFFKHLNHIYGNGAIDETKERTAVFASILRTTIALIRKGGPQITFTIPESIDRTKRILALTYNLGVNDFYAWDNVFPSVAEDVVRLWDDPSFQYLYQQHKNDMRVVFDGADHFIYQLEKLLPPGEYSPSFSDSLRAYVPSVGIADPRLKFGNTTLKFLGLGGRRNERKKWIHAFEGAGLILFFVSLADYDQVCYEDDTTNRLKESLDLWSEICNSKFFPRVPKMLMFSKVDVFRQKLATSDLKTYFPEYEGGSDFDLASNFIQQMFQSAVASNTDLVSYHYLDATSEDSVKSSCEQILTKIEYFGIALPDTDQGHYYRNKSNYHHGVVIPEPSGGILCCIVMLVIPALCCGLCCWPCFTIYEQTKKCFKKK